MSLKDQVEAALFGAGRPLTVREIIEVTEGNAEKVRRALKGLAEDYESRGGALEVVKTGRKWSMQLREEYAVGQSLAATELPKDLVKTAALIAYHQPIRQAELKRMVGDKVYDHVRILREDRLIRTSPAGHTLLLSTTRRFPEYFGIQADSRDALKRWMSERVSGRP
jgi:segregation and condensation protein B